MSEDDTTYGLVMPFHDESQSFSNGFEVGMIWVELRDGTFKGRRTVRVENQRQLEATARVFKKRAVFEDCGTEGWLWFSIEPLLAVVPNTKEGET